VAKVNKDRKVSEVKKVAKVGKVYIKKSLLAGAPLLKEHTYIHWGESNLSAKYVGGQQMIAIGDRIRIERDETIYPSRGTWPQFRGRIGTVVSFNRGEAGVCFEKVRTRTRANGRVTATSDMTVWFQPHEVKLATDKRAQALSATLTDETPTPRGTAA
jgi:hypothetical protein